MKTISLTKGQVALVDDEDFEYLNQWKWYAHRAWGNSFYAARMNPRPNKKVILMHREVFKDSRRCDHRDGNGLNNQKENLRPATKRQNGRNRGPQINNTSGFKGVSWCRKVKKWTVRIMYRKCYRFLGYFLNKHDAARAYDTAAKKYFGKFACPNFK